MEKSTPSARAGLDRRNKWSFLVRNAVQSTKSISTWFKGLSFIQWHYFYFIATSLVFSIIFWGSSRPAKSVTYIDSLFLCVSAITEAGLNTVNLSELNSWQQVLLLILIILGSAIFVSSSILHIRKKAFERRFAELIELRRKRLRRPRTMTFGRSRRTSAQLDDRDATMTSGVPRDQLGDAVSKNDQHADSSSSADRHQLADSDEAKPLPDSTQSPNLEPAFDDVNTGRIRFEDSALPANFVEHRTRKLRRSASFFEGRGVGAHALNNHPRNARPMVPHDAMSEFAIEDDPSPPDREQQKLHKYIDTVGGYLGRNSQFHHLSEEERHKLGGIEYDAICLLSWLVPAYFVLFQLFGAIGVGTWVVVNLPDAARKNGLDPFWTGAFFAVSAFNNSGMALLDANAVALNRSYYCMLTLSLLILAGNTMYPPFLRLSLCTLEKLIPKNASSPEWQRRRRTIQFCLDHPRRVYTNLFPSSATWWLVASVAVLNAIDWAAFELLNIGNDVVDSLSPGFRIVAGLFQAFAVRSGGFYIISISGLRSGLLVLYVLMMYLSAFPVTMTIRNTNVYEERSLGIFADELPVYQQGEYNAKDTDKKDGILTGLKRTFTMTHGGQAPKNSAWKREDFVRLQLRSQLGHDLWWLALAIFAITAIETGQFERDPVNFSTFNIIFEVISAYGCVGISVGIPWSAYSFCGTWQLASKLILCAVMLRGRHRGLPVSIDHAILLPNETLAWAEEEDAHKRTTSFHSEMAMHTRARTSAMASTNALHRPVSAISGAAGPSIQFRDTASASEQMV